MRLPDFENDPDGRRRREREREIHVQLRVMCNKFSRSMQRLIEEMERAKERVKTFIEAHPELKERDGPDA